jgi:hypothetical protein
MPSGEKNGRSGFPPVGSNIGMIERSRHFGFALETGNAVRIPCEFFRQDFDRHISAEFLVLGLKYLAGSEVIWVLQQTLRRKQGRQIRACDRCQTKLSKYPIDSSKRNLTRRCDLDSDRFSTPAEIHNNARISEHCSIAFLARTPGQVVISCYRTPSAESHFKIMSRHFRVISRE